MRGVILAGGTGSRLFPSTKVTNKHLLPVFNKPMIHYPIETLKNSGIRDILIVTGAEHAGDFMQLLGSGLDFGVNFTYRVQDGSGGIAQALSLAEDFAQGDPIAVVLSDNIFEEDFTEDVFYFKSGAQIFVKEVDEPERFGVVELDSDGLVKSIQEKPALPRSRLAQTGFSIYDSQVFDFIRTLEPSARGELEITDVNNIYRNKKQLKALQIQGMWIDAGTHTSLLEASILAQESFDPERVKRRIKSKEGVQSPAILKIPKVTIGILTHNSEAYVQHCLNSLKAQNYDHLEIVVFDNNSSDDTRIIIEENFPEVRLLTSEENLGFGTAHNRIMHKTENDMYGCFNVDMIFEPNFVSEMVKTLEKKPIYGSVGGKIKRWDFQTFSKNPQGMREMGKTNFIDSFGLRILKSHRFEDIGQGEVDYGQYDNEQEVFGVSGAAVLYRRKALDDIAFINEEEDREYFDESMFMYKEDIDLAYRLQWAGWRCLYTPHSIAYHDRSVSAQGKGVVALIRNRQRKSKTVNQISYLNHQILLRKNFASDFSPKVRGATWWYNFKVFVYILIFETELLVQWWKFFRLKKNIDARRKAMPRRISKAEIEKFMEG